jgi:hypothetical protein
MQDQKLLSQNPCYSQAPKRSFRYQLLWHRRARRDIWLTAYPRRSDDIISRTCGIMLNFQARSRPFKQNELNQVIEFSNDAIDVVVDDAGDVFVSAREFEMRVFQAAFDDFLAIGASGSDASFQVRGGWGKEKDGESFWAKFHSVHCALDIDLEDGNLSCKEHRFHIVERCCIAVPVHEFVLEKGAILDELIEALAADEMIVGAIDFAVARGASGVGDDALDAGIGRLPGLEDGVLAHTTWAAEDDEPSLVAHAKLPSGVCKS